MGAISKIGSVAKKGLSVAKAPLKAAVSTVKAGSKGAKTIVKVGTKVGQVVADKGGDKILKVAKDKALKMAIDSIPGIEQFNELNSSYLTAGNVIDAAKDTPAAISNFLSWLKSHPEALPLLPLTPLLYGASHAPRNPKQAAGVVKEFVVKGPDAAWEKNKDMTYASIAKDLKSLANMKK